MKNPNTTLHLDVEKVSLEDLSGVKSRDSLAVSWATLETSQNRYNYNYTPPTRSTYYISLYRKVLPVEMEKQKLSQMPGFRYTWRYSGMEVEPEADFTNHPITMAFIRN